MDSLDWTIGFTTEQINSLTDDDMQAIADGLQEQLSKAVGGFRGQIEAITLLYIVDQYNQATGGTNGRQEQEPLRQDREASTGL